MAEIAKLRGLFNFGDYRKTNRLWITRGLCAHPSDESKNHRAEFGSEPPG